MTSQRRYRNGRKRRGMRSATSLRLEALESRLNFSGVPLGAAPTDTGEYMLGDITVTVVFLESMQTGGIDASTENWTQAEITANKAKVDEAMQWWVDTLALQNSVHELNFHINYQYADTPVPTRYEPISRPATDFDKWAGDFLNYVNAERTGDIVKDIRLFNDSQRVAAGTNWAFTIFVADSSNDADGYWQNSASIAGGFSVAGGAFIALPSSRGAISIAHETAHQFWAMDEYGGKKYSDHRGYYDTQNTNAIIDNPNQSLIVDSLMLSGTRMQNAYANHTSSQSMFESIGWKDSDGDGIFDVLDQPLSLKGSGAVDAATLEYHFVGQASVGVLLNLNPAGVQQNFNQFLQHDITINTVAEVQYRFDGGAWQTAETYDEYVADIDIRIALPDSALHQIEIRAVDATGAIASNLFTAVTAEIAATSEFGATGFLFDDQNRNGVFDSGETGLSGWSVQLVDSQSMPVTTQIVVEPDNFAAGDTIDDLVPGASFTAFGANIDVFNNVFSLTNTAATTGSRVLGYYRSSEGSTGHFSEWNQEQQLRVDFDSPVSRVSLDAIGVGFGSIGRLEAYDFFGNLIGRYTTAELASGQAETMNVELNSPQISYIIVAGQLATSVRFDNFSAGQPATVETDQFGAFALPIDVAGNYQLKITPPAVSGQNYLVTGSSEAAFAMQPLSGFRFAVKSEPLNWRNPYLQADVNDDGQIDEIDLNLALNELTNPAYSSNHQFLIDRPSGAPFLDVNGDGFYNLLDMGKVLETILRAKYAIDEEGVAASPVESGFGENESPAESDTTSFASDATEAVSETFTDTSTQADATAPLAGDGDWGLGNLDSTAQEDSFEIALEGEAVVQPSATSSGSTNAATEDDRILAEAADNIYLALASDDDSEAMVEFDPFFGVWDLLE